MSKKETFTVYCENPECAMMDVEAECEEEAIEYAKNHESEWSFTNGYFDIYENEIHI